MDILSVRLGLATNSSSSHSLIWLPEGVTVNDYPGYEPDNGSLSDFGDFGWQHFTAVSAEVKMRYLAVMLKTRLQQTLPENIANTLIHSWLGDVSMDEEDGMDHESFMYIPSQHGTKIPSEQFTKDLAKYLLQDRLVILGGNDNTRHKHPLDDGSAFNLPIPREMGHWSEHICRYDEQYKYWTIFCCKNGNKIRMRFDHPPESHQNVRPTKSSTPELIDLNITTFCPRKCEYCYQGAGPTGEHAGQYECYRIAEDLAALEVFEVAIGGGEPTLHPDFLAILQSFKDRGIVPNFTTRSTEWLKDYKIANKVMELCGAFGFSVQSVEEIREVSRLLAEHEFPPSKCNIHIVLGTITEDCFKELLVETGIHHFNTTILGFKQVGRGAGYTPHAYGDWLSIVKDQAQHRNWDAKIGIDTPLAAEFQDQLIAMEIPSWLYETKEGGFSCYIDAVDKKIGPSSYCKPEEMKPLKCEADWEEEGWRDQVGMIYDAFQTF